MEVWDAYNEDLGLFLDFSLVRGEAIPDGVYHLVCDIIVRHSDGSYLLMQRDYKKDNGGMWEATAGGSALKGEDPEQCAKRELYEETGILSSNLIEVGRVVDDVTHTIYVEFLCETDVCKTSVTLRKDETINYRWVDTETLLNLEKDYLLTERMQKFIEELKDE